MPKLKNRPPEYRQSGKYACVYIGGERIYLGLYGSPESKAKYTRLLAEMEANPVAVPLSDEKKQVTISELAAGFLVQAKASLNSTDYDHYRIIVLDFLEKLYGDRFPVDDFKPKCLKLVREEMVKSRRFCRNTVNRYTFRIISIFAWGVEMDLVPEKIWRTLKVVKSLKKGYPGTFDHPEREAVPYEIVAATLPFMPQTVAAMVQLQWLTGMRPSEVFNMRVGDIDRSRESESLWYYTPRHHKTEETIGKKPIPLGKAEQALIEPYLIGKKSADSVFSPRTAMKERAAEARANRKTKRTPSQRERDAKRAEKNESRVGEFYDRISFRNAVKYAIEKANRHGVKVLHWSPYLLRNSNATMVELEHGLDAAQAQLGHVSANTTRRYSKAQLKIREALATNRRNPFGSEDKGE